jgi:Flp pilus assembly protein TadG
MRDAVTRRNSSRLRSLLKLNSGGALVEIALLAPVFVAVLLGATEFAILAYQAIEVSDAARAGVAYGSQSTSTASNSSQMQKVAKAASPDVSALQATPSMFYACSSTPATHSSTSPTNCATGDHVLTYVEVTTTATVTPTIHVPGLPSSYTLNGLAIMRVQ